MSYRIVFSCPAVVRRILEMICARDGGMHCCCSDLVVLTKIMLQDAFSTTCKVPVQTFIPICSHGIFPVLKIPGILQPLLRLSEKIGNYEDPVWVPTQYEVCNCRNVGHRWQPGVTILNYIWGPLSFQIKSALWVYLIPTIIWYHVFYLYSKPNCINLFRT